MVVGAAQIEVSFKDPGFSVAIGCHVQSFGWAMVFVPETWLPALPRPCLPAHSLFPLCFLFCFLSSHFPTTFASLSLPLYSHLSLLVSLGQLLRGPAGRLGSEGAARSLGLVSPSLSCFSQSPKWKPWEQKQVVVEEPRLRWKGTEWRVWGAQIHGHSGTQHPVTPCASCKGRWRSLLLLT